MTIMMCLEHMIIVSAADAGMSCLNVVKEFVECRIRHAGTINVFLATDAGKFGSDALQTLLGKNSREVLAAIFGYIFDETITLEDYENSFEDVTGTQNGGYVSTLQKTLACRDHCLLMIGGGLFQQHALWWYNQNYVGSETCVITLMMC